VLHVHHAVTLALWHAQHRRVWDDGAERESELVQELRNERHLTNESGARERDGGRAQRPGAGSTALDRLLAGARHEHEALHLVGDESTPEHVPGDRLILGRECAERAGEIEAHRRAGTVLCRGMARLLVDVPNNGFRGASNRCGMPGGTHEADADGEALTQSKAGQIEQELSLVAMR